MMRGFVGRLIFGSCLFSLLMVAGVEVALAQAEEKLGPNLIENGDFEAESAESTWGLDTPGQQQMMSEGAHGGKSCLKLICQKSGDDSFQSRDHKKQVAIDPAKTYRISCWIKVQGEGAFFLKAKSVTDAGKNNKPPQPGVRDSLGVKDTGGNWKEVELNYQLMDDEMGVKAVVVSPRIRGKGEVLIDDVEVRERSKQAIVAEQLKLETYSTIHCMGLRIKGVSEEIAVGKVEYRKAGEAAWREALPLALCLGNRFVEESFEGGVVNVAGTMAYAGHLAAWQNLAPMVRRLHGSLFYLEPDTTYEIKASLLDKDGKVKSALEATARTRPDGVAYGNGRTLKVGADAEHKTIQAAVKAAKPGDTVLVSPGVYKESVVEWVSGEPGNPVTVRGVKGAVIDGSGVPMVGDVHAGMNIKGRHDVIVEGFQIRGFEYLVFVEKSERVTIQKNVIDCEVDPGQKSTRYGIRVKECKDCLVQMNAAIGAEKGAPPGCIYSVPGGCEGLVFRYNRVNGGRCGRNLEMGASQEVDIYENLFGGNAFEGAEVAGGRGFRGPSINLRFWNNIVRSEADALTLSHIMVGPVYVCRNTCVSLEAVIRCADNGLVEALWAGCVMAESGPIFLYHNSFGAREGGRGFFASLGAHSRMMFVNNIFSGRALPYEMVAAAGKTCRRGTQGEYSNYAKVEADYNLYWDQGKTTGSPIPGLDGHSVFADPMFMDAAGSNFRLRKESPAVDKAVRLPNINDHFAGKVPDMGAFEFGSDWTGRTLKEELKDDPR